MLSKQYKTKQKSHPQSKAEYILKCVLMNNKDEANTHLFALGNWEIGSANLFHKF